MQEENKTENNILSEEVLNFLNENLDILEEYEVFSKELEDKMYQKFEMGIIKIQNELVNDESVKEEALEKEMEKRVLALKIEIETEHKQAISKFLEDVGIPVK